MKHVLPEPSSTLGALAEFLASTPSASVPKNVMERAADCVLDCLSSASAGAGERAVASLLEVMNGSRTSRGGATLWYHGGSADVAAAATVNALSATILDVDDGHRRAKGHAGAAVISAALAAAEDLNTSYQDFLAAVVMGYEAAVRVATSRVADRQVDTASGIWSGVGAAVAVARLSGANPLQMAHAVLIAEQHSPQLASAMQHGFAGADVKEGIPWSVMTGIHAARLAIAGFSGYPRTFDLPNLYQIGKIAEDLQSFSVVPGTYIKPYACCRWIHSAVDGVLDIMEGQNLSHDGIEFIEVKTFHRAVTLANHVEPRTMVDAQFSIPFCVALACAHGREAMLPLNPHAIKDRTVTGLAARVSVTFDAEMEGMFPVYAPAIITLRHSGITHMRRVESPFGEPANPMSRQDILIKFFRLGEPSLGKARIEAMGSALAAETSSIQPVRDLLSPLL